MPTETTGAQLEKRASRPGRLLLRHLVLQRREHLVDVGVGLVRRRSAGQRRLRGGRGLRGGRRLRGGGGGQELVHVVVCAALVADQAALRRGEELDEEGVH